MKNDRNICMYCKEPALEKCYSEDGIKEFYISGLCEKCFDEIMQPSDDYDDYEEEPAF